MQRRITSYTLAIYFYLLQGKTLSIPYVANRIPREELDLWCDKLERIVNRALTACQDSERQAEKLFLRKKNNGIYEISLLEQQRSILKEFLQKYCEDLTNENLKTVEHNTHEWDYTRKTFIEKLKDKHYNLKCFHSKSIKDIYQLAPELIRLCDNGGYTLVVKINAGLGYTSGHGALDDYLKRILSFKCSLDLSGIVEEQKKKRPIVINVSESAQDCQEESATKNKPTMKDVMLEKIDELVLEKGLGAEILLKDIIDLYKNIAKDFNCRCANNISKTVKNYVSAYRTKKATTLTLSRMNTYPNESYFIEKNL